MLFFPLHLYTHVYARVCTCVCMCVHMCVSVHECVYTDVCMWTRAYVCACVSTCANMYRILQNEQGHFLTLPHLPQKKNQGSIVLNLQKHAFLASGRYMGEGGKAGLVDNCNQWVRQADHMIKN